MKLYCVRHAQAMMAAEDVLRELSEQGTAEATQVGQFLAKAQLQVGHIIHSQARRTEMTAAIIGQALSCQNISQCSTGISPEDQVEDMVPVVDAWEEDTMVVTHLPFIARFVSKLVTGGADQSLWTCPPCTVICLERSHHGGLWSVEWMLTPSLLGTVPAQF